MQIIIEIDEEEYQTYINHTEAILDSSIPLVHQDLLRAVINGTPLPKGHGRLIEDTPKLERELWTYTRYTGIDEAPYESAVKVIDEAPTIIEADGGDAE